ncbi:MAG: Ig-like domain-containing protein, partial [Planctomycetes bacterium]|nr:Ig-like domain-containing protein [Planctomycetota bacterium]
MRRCLAMLAPCAALAATAATAGCGGPRRTLLVAAPVPGVQDTSATAVSGAANDLLTVLYTADVVMAGAEDPGNFSLESPIGTPVSLAGASLRYDPPARTTAMSLGAGRDLRRGASYRLRVARVRSLAGVEVLPDSGQDGTVGGDAAGPTVLRAVQDTAADPTGATLQLRFDEAVEATTAGSASSYASSGPATASAALLFDAQSVRVRLQSPATPGVTTLAVQGVKDLAGNLMAPATSLAVAAPDTTPPGLAQVAAESVPGGPPDEVRVRYDEPVDAVDAVDAARYALESPTGTPLSLSGAGLSYDTAAQTARLQLSGASLAAGASFQVRVTGVRDVFGNAMGSTAAGGTVTTAFAGLDAEPPRIAGASARSVSGPSNDTVQVVYDEEVDSSAAATLASYRLESPTGAQRDLTGSRVAYDAATRTATITLDAPAGGVTLATGASFTVLVDGVRDAAGNPVYPGTSRAGKVEGDATPPRVTGAVQDLGLDPTARTVAVDFDEAVDAAAAGAPGSYSLGTGGPATVSATPQAGGTRVLLAFASAVLPGRDTLTVKDVRDLAGNVIVTTAQALSSTDGTPPTLAGLAARSASGAANDTVVVTYSEPVVESDAVARSNFVLESPTGTVLDLGTADLRYDAAARATAITLGGGRPVDLRTGASATVRLTAVRDLAGNALAAGAAASSQVAGDATPPAIASSAATAVSGAANDTIAVVYDEDVEAAGASDPASYALEQPTGAARPLATATASYDAATRTATLTLGGGSPVDLSTRAGGDSYTVRVSGVRDLAGNAAAGVSSSGTVGGDRAPPTVARAVQVAPDTVDVAFSEVVSAASVLAAGFAATGGAPATTSATLLAGGTAVRVVFAAAFPGTGTLEVQGVSDLAGNLLAPVAGQPVVGDTTPPALASSSLVTVSGPGNDRVALTYDEDVQPGTATDPANFALESPTGTPLSLAGATLAYDAPARTTRLTLAAPARTGASYTAVVGGVKDTAGNTMAFGTRAAGTVGGDLVAPTVASSSPPGGSSGVATGTPVEVRFSEAMDPASITSSSVRILFGAGSPVAGTLALDASGRVATFTPTAGLAPDATHELAVTTLATDLAGNAATAFTTSFRTAATVLALTAVDPAEGTAAGGQTVTLTGTGFRLGTTVSLGALRATAVEVQSATRIRCLVPAAAAPSASGPVAVDVALARPDGQTAALAGGYRYLADTTSPEVSLVQPVHGANGVRRNQRVVLVYSEPLDPATVIHNGGAGDTVLVYRDSGHPVRPTTDRITGTVALNARGDRLSFTPPGDWGSNKGVRIGLTDGVHDRAGNRLVQGSAGSLLSLGGLVGGQVFESSFRTGNRNDSQAPAVFTYSPAQGATGVSALKVVELTFTEPVDPVTVTTATFRVEKGTSPIAGATALTPDGLVASFTPELALDGATAYTVR